MNAKHPPAADYRDRFAGIARLYGEDGAALIRELHVCVVGVGGVGSWAVEALARSGVGRLSFIDSDEAALSNINRQIHTLDSMLGRSKVELMAERVAGINPACDCRPIDDFLTSRNLDTYLDRGYDYVIDAIDSIKFKADLVYYCKRNRIPVVATGGAGGLTDPTAIKVADLSRTYNDPLAAKVRARLRSEYGWTRNPQRRFGVECVFSSQQQFYPRGDGSVGHQKPGIHGVSLDCRFGYGSTTLVTATFGMIAASRVINRTLRRRLKRNFEVR
ncbi:tRNA cyclic N6-threonylcarbamoyladenosine(37) synthase TcdA [Thiohalobacter sp. IOR34]|uniref:tRNA cyclic N6-threonylcarbamoyladenosine(37) synthase TcdA n=1 Tax=Thiohalobacter sp. IOR34 TaxID=3057176 RepID=UPI0025B1E237|nr:tRNA cyclic N6-threonylcarbamoyladenosine(37) synthase TcdA [Thiohalobacter sp. IOR34]WJW74641.1 tRNA cyclic N6-threonylcarbamoyladenosine(37) synthase TcdA [Thiohalobacter sp. IOR34]